MTKLTQQQDKQGNVRLDENSGGKRKTAQTVALCGVFIALAMIMSYIESLIPFNFGIPGVKLGLANLCVMTCLYVMSPLRVLLIMFLRVLLSSLLFGSMASFLYSISGGLLSFLVMLLLKKTGKFGTVGVSIAGGVSHNIGQLIVAMFVVETFGIVSYLPVLLLSGALTGCVIGSGAVPVIKRVAK